MARRDRPARAPGRGAPSSRSPTCPGAARRCAPLMRAETERLVPQELARRVGLMRAAARYPAHACARGAAWPGASASPPVATAARAARASSVGPRVSADAPHRAAPRASAVRPVRGIRLFAGAARLRAPALVRRAGRRARRRCPCSRGGCKLCRDRRTAPARRGGVAGARRSAAATGAFGLGDLGARDRGQSRRSPPWSSITGCCTPTCADPVALLRGERAATPRSRATGRMPGGGRPPALDDERRARVLGADVASQPLVAADVLDAYAAGTASVPARRRRRRRALSCAAVASARRTCS